MVSRIDNIHDIPDIDYYSVNVTKSETLADSLVREYVSTISSYNKNAKYEPEQPVNDIYRFFELVQASMVSKQNSEGVKEEKRILFIVDDPPVSQQIDTEAITCFLLSREPGRFDQGPAGPSKIREISPHVRGIVDHPQHPGEKLITYGRFYDNMMVFNVYARSNKVALSRVLWFQRLMSTYNWIFRYYGFTVVEKGVANRERIKLDELDVVKYPMVYFVRTDDISHSTTQELRKVVIDVEMSATRHI